MDKHDDSKEQHSDSKEHQSVTEKDSILQRASNPDANGKKEKTQRQKNIIYLTVALLCIIAIAAIPVGTYFFTSPNSPLSKEEDGTPKTLAEAAQVDNPSLVNDEVTKGNKDYFLNSIDGLDNTEGAFVFAAEHLDAKEVSRRVADKEIVPVDVYITFTGRKSLDTLLNHLEVFKQYISDESIVLIVHPVYTTVDASTFIPEAIAQVAAADSSKTWDMLEESLAAGVITLRGNYEDDVIIKLLAKTAQSLGISDITDDTLKAKHFEHWLLENQKEVNEIVKDFVPVVLIGGVKVDNSSVNVLDTDSLFRAIDKQIVENSK